MSNSQAITYTELCGQILKVLEKFVWPCCCGCVFTHSKTLLCVQLCQEECPTAFFCSIGVMQASLRAAHWNLPTLTQLLRLEQR